MTLKEIEIRNRWVIAMRSLGMTEIRRQITSQLLLYPDPVRVSTLSETLGYSRRSIRQWLNDGLKRGSVDYIEGLGWTLNPGGRKLVCLMYTEAERIAQGKQGGFSQGFLEYASRYSLPTDRVVG